MASVEYPNKESVAANVAKYPSYYQYPYLNSGVGLGYAWALERVFSRILKHPVFDDQVRRPFFTVSERVLTVNRRPSTINRRAPTQNYLASGRTR